MNTDGIGPSDFASEAALDQLMVDYQAGQLSAFEELFYAFRQPLWHYLYSRVMNRSRADDLLQETFLQIHLARKTYQPGRSVKRWAFGVARNVCLMDYRQRRRAESREFSPDTTLEKMPAPTIDNRAHDRRLLQQALGLLSPDEREVLLLRHQWGFSFEEIGAILGIRTGTARVRAFRATQNLNDLMKQTSVTNLSADDNNIR
jgi:RNA polymerase sigma-70 factor (ECF subfamily)